MRRAMHAEWTKLRTLPATAWLVLATVGLTVAVSAAATAAVDTSHCPSPAECFEDTTKLSLTGVRLGQIAVVVLAVLAIGNEYATGMIRTTLAASPRRRTVLLAKATVLAVTVLAAGVVAVLGSLAVGGVILPGNGFAAPSLTDWPTVRAAFGTVLYLVLVALLALGVGAAVRDTAGALTAALTLIYIAPAIAELVTDPRWHDRLQKLAPMTAGLAIQATTRLDRLPIGPWAGLGVLAAYAAAAMAVGGLLLVIRDQ